MFRCYFCQKITPPKTTRHSVVIESRQKQYSARRPESKRRNFRDRDRDRDESVQDRGGQGIEIIKEVDACPECAAKQHQEKPLVSPSTPMAKEVASASSAERTVNASLHT